MTEYSLMENIVNKQTYTPKPRDNSDLFLYDICPIDILSNIISRFQLEGSDYKDAKEYELKQKRLADKIMRVIVNNINGGVFHKHYTDDNGYNEDGLPETIKLLSIKLSEFAAWAISKKDKFKCPKEILDLAPVVREAYLVEEEKLTATKIIPPTVVLGNINDSDRNDDSLSLTERRSYGMLKLQKDDMEKSLRAAVAIAMHYEKLEDGVKFDKDALLEKLRELGYGKISNTNINIIYQALPPDHKRKPGEKKSNDKK